MTKKKAPSDTKRKSIPTPRDLQKALDRFPDVVKLKEKAAREKKKIMKNFLSVKDKVYRES